MPEHKHPFERPDDRSLVAVVDLTPITMGERVRRYMRTPSLRDDLIFHDPKYDPDDFYDDEDRPMAPHEERYDEFVERKKQRKTELDEKRRKDAEEKQKSDDEEFVKRVKAVKSEIPKTE